MAGVTLELAVRATGAARRRGGMSFTAERTEMPFAGIDRETFAALVEDPQLVVELVCSGEMNGEKRESSLLCDAPVELLWPIIDEMERVVADTIPQPQIPQPEGADDRMEGGAPVSGASEAEGDVAEGAASPVDPDGSEDGATAQEAPSSEDRDAASVAEPASGQEPATPASRPAGSRRPKA